MLSASQEGLPLGDLNWYPDQKFQWFANKDIIEAHILDLNEGVIELQDPATIYYQVKLSLRDSENNPLLGALLVIGEDSLYSDASGMIILDTLAGTYAYQVSAPGYKEESGNFSLEYAAYQAIIVLQESLVGQNSWMAKWKIQMYPNPVNAGEMLNIGVDHAEPWDEIRVSVYDIQGKLLSLEKFNDQNILAISTVSFTKGIYLVKVLTGNIISNYNSSLIF